ncbi:chorismate synthase [uncultured Clostridium sp.]|uniref:chorismate synthase n=1 Tax=uncultured Clostridium sp. TaxID=59620 RepID=UPI0025FC3972|nr:chorismate synthase [uncultured Clostridium sp.]
MSSIIGTKVKISVFGESHGEAIGVVIDGLPAGYDIDFDKVYEDMKRRAPGQDKFSTPRAEKDMPRVLSGIFNGKTTGAPLAAIIENSNTKSKDYSELKIKMRPSHSDYPAMIKYDGYNDYRGGGHFSGRLTAMFVFAGAVCKEILKQRDIYVGSHIKSIRNVKDDSFDKTNITKELLDNLRENRFPTLNKNVVDEMQKEILDAKNDLDSVGGVIEAAIINLPAGIGDPMFNSVESVLSHMLFSIPAVKGVEFGEGFNIATLRGSEANDSYYIEDGKIKTYTNNNGGILGGITNGMPVVFSLAIKPTPSISKPQKTVNVETMENDILEIHGRHDPCIVQRAVPVVECAAAVAILDILLQEKQQ